MGARDDPCVACLDKGPKTTLLGREQMFGMGDVFEYLECGACGTVFQPRPADDLARYYPAHYYSYEHAPVRPDPRSLRARVVRAADRHAVLGTGGLVGALASRRRQIDGHLDDFPRSARTGLRILDVGCGSGAWLRTLAGAGCRHLTGCDPFNPEPIVEDGFTIVDCDVAAVGGTYDLVAFHHSLEHVPDPARALAAARRLLAPGGRVLVRVPTVSSDAFATYREHWVQLDAPRHLSLFSLDGFAHLARRAGLEVVVTRWDSGAFQFWGSEGYRRGLTLQQMWATPPFPRRTLRRWARAADVANRAGRGDQVAFVLAPVAGAAPVAEPDR
jgi:SAM-dependent methyltransferase